MIAEGDLLGELTRPKTCVDTPLFTYSKDNTNYPLRPRGICPGVEEGGQLPVEVGNIGKSEVEAIKAIGVCKIV
eukprot:5016651-Pleurochrysis_carterae.AAC.2